MRRVTALLLRPAVKLSLVTLDARLKTIPKANDAPFASAVGPDPLHVLILGYGVGPGWGVTTHALAMPGQLARALSQRLGRGVEVEVITEDTTLPWLVTLLQRLDLSTFDAIVLSPGAYEALSFMPVAQWRSQLSEAVALARASDGGDRPVVLLGIPPLDPVTSRESILGSRVADHARDLEAAMADLVDLVDHPSVHHVPLVTMKGRLELRDNAPDRYRAWSESVAAALAPHLSSHDVTREEAPAPPLARLTALMRSAFDADAAFVASADGARVWSDARRTHRGLERAATPLLLQAASQTNEPIFDVRIDDRVAVVHPLHGPDGPLVGVSAVMHSAPESIDRRLMRNLGVLIASELRDGGAVTVSS